MGACFPNHAYLVCCVLSHRKSLPASLFWNNIHISDPPAPQPFANCAPAPPEPGFQPQFRFFVAKMDRLATQHQKSSYFFFKTCLLHIWRPSSRSLLSFWARRRLSQLFSLCLRFYRNGSNFLVIGSKTFVQFKNGLIPRKLPLLFPPLLLKTFGRLLQTPFKGWSHLSEISTTAIGNIFILLVIIFYQGHLTLSL